MAGKFTKLKQNRLSRAHHNIRITKEIKNDLVVWRKFLQRPEAVSRPFADFDENKVIMTPLFYTDASKAKNLGCGGWCNNEWFVKKWSPDFITTNDLAYLELYYALTCAFLLWAQKYKNIHEPLDNG